MFATRKLRNPFCFKFALQCDPLQGRITHLSKIVSNAPWEPFRATSQPNRHTCACHAIFSPCSPCQGIRRIEWETSREEREGRKEAEGECGERNGNGGRRKRGRGGCAEEEEVEEERDIWGEEERRGEGGWKGEWGGIQEVQGVRFQVGGLHSSGYCQISEFENKYIIGAGERRCQRRGGERIARDPLRRETPPALRRTGLSPFFAVFPARPADILDQRGGGEGARERARERETDRQTDRPRQRQRDRETKRQRDRERASPPHSPCRRG